MINFGKIIILIVAFFVSTISLAVTCASSDSECILNQRKLQLMSEMDIKPTATKDLPKENKEEKKPSRPLPFQVPRPVITTIPSSLDSGQSLPEGELFPKVERNPGLKLPPPTPVDQSAQEQQQFQFQIPKSPLQPQMPQQQSKSSANQSTQEQEFQMQPPNSPLQPQVTQQPLNIYMH